MKEQFNAKWKQCEEARKKNLRLEQACRNIAATIKKYEGQTAQLMK